MNNWITIPLELQSVIGTSEKVAKEVSARVAQHISLGEYSPQDIENIASRRISLYDDKVVLSKKRLEMIRSLCKLWEVRLQPQQITSHRKVIGPIIVSVKKLLFPIFYFFMKDFIREQREFNAAAVKLLAELSKR